MRLVAVAIPIKTPQAKKPVVTSCSQSHGRPSSRVTTSQQTESVKPAIEIPHRIMRRCSSGSSALHFRWRWRGITRDSVTAAASARTLWATAPIGAVARRSTDHKLHSLYVADQFEDLHGMGAQLLGKLVLNRLSRRSKARFIDAVDHLHAHFFQLLGGLGLKLERLGRLGLGNLVGRGLDPLLLLIAQTVPGLVADPDAVVVGFVFRQRQDRGYFVVFVGHVNIDAVLGDIDDAGLQ